MVARWNFGLDGRGLKRLTRNRDGSEIHVAEWSPDGTRIAFCADPALDAFPAVWVINADGSGARKLSRGRSSCGLAWSPSGNWVAFARYPAGLYAVRPDGSGLRAIARDLPVSSISWTR